MYEEREMCNLKCEWMSIKLESPYVIASLTMLSHVELVRHVEYYKKVKSSGAGAAVLPSVNPEFQGNSRRNAAMVDSIMLKTGLNSNHNMGFSVLGPTNPNIVSLDYGVALAKALKQQCGDWPVIASVANIGNEENVIAAVKELSGTGVDGIELNFSCPNVRVKDNRRVVLTNELLKKIRKSTALPISLKITPFDDYTGILDALEEELDGLTLSNAYIGLIPPKIKGECFSPFEKREDWAPSGVYGPFEKALTFYRVYAYRKIAQEKRLSIACVGGIVNGEEAIQAILLGADIVQFSSAVAWKGINIFEESNEALAEYLCNNGYRNVDAMKKAALPYIKENADVLNHDISKAKMKVDNTKCKKCTPCKCCERLCLAITQDSSGEVSIEKSLCSGCRWCYYSCLHHAIEETE